MRSASIPCNAWWCGPDGWLNVQFLVERSLEKCLRTSQPYLVYGPETSHDEEYRVPPGMSYPVFVNGIALMPDLGCRSLLSNAFIMNTIMVRPSHPAKLLQAGLRCRKQGSQCMHVMCLQAWRPDLLLGEDIAHCNPIIASRLNVSILMWSALTLLLARLEKCRCLLDGLISTAVCAG